MTAGEVAGWVLAIIPPLLLIIGRGVIVRARTAIADSQPVQVVCPMPAEIKPAIESAPEPTPPVRDEWDKMMDKISARMSSGLKP